MEKHKCKLCLKSFANGRALGGHMRSHTLNLPVKLQENIPMIHLSEEEETELASSSSSSEEEEDDEKGQSYGLRENPKRSIRLVDPEFSFAPVDPGTSSIVLQDRESETESSKYPTRKRSKRGWKPENDNHGDQKQNQEQGKSNSNSNLIKKFKLNQFSKSETWAEPEPVSSISDATTEEDVAFCLMMLSRDKWKKQDEEEADEETEQETYETDESDSKHYKNNRARGKYKCETCNRVFKSYQALGGHRASHKKFKSINYSNTASPDLLEQLEPANVGSSDKKIHECPVCFRVFASGQALGGHKRSHVTGLVATTSTIPAKSTTSTKFGDNSNNTNSFIDLNLPAVEDDDYSQIELSAVSDAEFVNHIRR